MSRIRRLAAVLAVCSSLPAQRTVIRTETRVVLVDAVVRDKKGKLVRDLAASDFRVFEDGKEQPVTSFTRESAGTAPHYLLLLFDSSFGSHTELILARRDAAKFVSAWAGPDRYMAVANFTGPLAIRQNFTTKPEPLVAAIHAMLDAASSTTDGPKSEADTIRRSLPGNRDGSQNTPATVIAAGVASARSTLPEMETAQAVDGGGYFRQGLLRAVESAAQSMASIRGRKSLALIGFGGIESDPMGLAAAIRACNRANVGVYVMNQPGLKSLAEETGGRVLAHTRDLAGELGKVAEDQDEHYMLGYVPPESAHECHSLRVEVKRSGVDVRARQQYCTTRAVETAAAPAPPAAGSLDGALSLPYFYTAPNRAKVNVAMEMAAGPIAFTKVKGKPHAEVSVVGVAYKPAGEIGGRFTDTVNLDFATDKEVEAFRKQGLHYEYQFDLPPGQYRFEVTAGAGKIEAPLTIDPWDGRSFALSGLALSKEARPVTDLASALDDSLLEDRRPLIARSIQIVPSGSHRFRRGEACRWYAEIYRPRAGERAPAVQVRVLDRATGSQRMDSGAIAVTDFVRAGNSTIPVALDVPVHLLPPGSYRLEVKALDPASGASVIRTADFEVTAN